jgi:hypothetical protein
VVVHTPDASHARHAVEKPADVGRQHRPGQANGSAVGVHVERPRVGYRVAQLGPHAFGQHFVVHRSGLEPPPGRGHEVSGAIGDTARRVGGRVPDPAAQADDPVARQRPAAAPEVTVKIVSQGGAQARRRDDRRHGLHGDPPDVTRPPCTSPRGRGLALWKG